MAAGKMSRAKGKPPPTTGPSDFTVGATEFQHHTGQVVLKLVRGSEKDKPDLYRQASPLFHVSKDSPPLLLAHGEQDDLVPFDQSVRVAEAYRRLGCWSSSSQ